MAKHTKKKLTKTRRLVRAAFREVSENPPARLKKTRKKFGRTRANKQKIAIALSKARKAGARIPKKRKKK